MVTNKIGLSRDFIIHPGETLKEMIEERNMNQNELAIRCGVSEKHISTVLNGQKNISVDFARKLEYALGIDSIFWINLQTNYDKELLEFQEINQITKEELDIFYSLKDIIKEYIRYGFVEKGLCVTDELIQIRKVLNISNLTNIYKFSHLGVFRIQSTNSVNQYALFAWEKLCDLIDNNNSISNDEFNIDKLIYLIPEIKKIMFSEEQDIVKKLQDIFSNCGISFYIVKHFNGVPVQGYIKKNNRNGLSMYITNRRKYADIFWFTVFHEIAHIINGDVKKYIIDFDNHDIENNTNKLAQDLLLKEEKYNAFIKENNFTINSIINFAKNESIQPYIVIGRLMKDNYIKYSDYSNYRQLYNFDI